MGCGTSKADNDNIGEEKKASSRSEREQKQKNQEKTTKPTEKKKPKVITNEENQVKPKDEAPAKPTIDPRIVKAKLTKVTVMGRECEAFIDTRTNPQKQAVSKPSVAPGELWQDPDFPYNVAMEGKPLELEWKRPGEFAEKPQLFTEGTTRFDVGQGGAGTCYFLSVLSALADMEELMKQVIVDDYCIGTSKYRGVFHCRFWRFGVWHDVYVDDCLPYRTDIKRVWGAYSASDKNKMWISLIEKALAKFFGSYKKAESGNPGLAFTSLTGGLCDRIEHKKTDYDVFSRVRNALASGCIVACTVGEGMGGQKGLIGRHAYAVTGATEIIFKGHATSLLRVRNPWGKQKGEWEGAWSDGAPEWDAVSEEVKSKLQVVCQGDGEFWIDQKDFMKHFQDTFICSFRPDFDEDGTQDDLKKTYIALGEWTKKTAAGHKIPQKFNNPRFTLDITSNESLPVVFQLSQQKKAAGDLAPIRLDVYKEEGTFKKPKISLVLNDLTNKTSYISGETVIYRYSLAEGKYILLPHTLNEGVLNEFMLRVFSSQTLKLKNYEENPAIFMQTFDIASHLKLASLKELHTEHHFGQWSDSNAGGQIGNKTHERNPQYALQVSGKEKIKVAINLKQDHRFEREAIGICVYQVQGSQKIPLSIDYLWEHYKKLEVKPLHGDLFVNAYEVKPVFALSPGLYSVIIFTNKPGVKRDYVLSFGFSAGAKVTVTGHNIVNYAICTVN